MPWDPEISASYRACRLQKKWARERLTTRWQLAQHAALNPMPLNGSSAIFKPPSEKTVGRRSVYKTPKHV